MGVKSYIKKVAQSTEESDRERLRDFCSGIGLTPLDELPLRTPVRVAGEVTSLRIVPRAGAPAVEITVRDGRGALVEEALIRLDETPPAVIGIDPLPDVTDLPTSTAFFEVQF